MFHSKQEYRYILLKCCIVVTMVVLQFCFWTHGDAASFSRGLSVETYKLQVLNIFLMFSLCAAFIWHIKNELMLDDFHL